jgi:hypothetical protein
MESSPSHLLSFILWGRLIIDDYKKEGEIRRLFVKLVDGVRIRLCMCICICMCVCVCG